MQEDQSPGGRIRDKEACGWHCATQEEDNVSHNNNMFIGPYPVHFYHSDEYEENREIMFLQPNMSSLMDQQIVSFK